MSHNKFIVFMVCLLFLLMGFAGLMRLRETEMKQDHELNMAKEGYIQVYDGNTKTFCWQKFEDKSKIDN